MWCSSYKSTLKFKKEQWCGFFASLFQNLQPVTRWPGEDSFIHGKTTCLLLHWAQILFCSKSFFFGCCCQGPQPACPPGHQVHPHQAQSLWRSGMDTLQPERPAVPPHWPEAQGQRALPCQQGIVTYYWTALSVVHFEYWILMIGLLEWNAKMQAGCINITTTDQSHYLHLSVSTVVDDWYAGLGFGYSLKKKKKNCCHLYIYG